MTPSLPRAALAVLISLHLPFAAQAGEVDLLIDKLVEKGVLSQADAEEIVTELQAERRSADRVPVEDLRTAPATAATEPSSGAERPWFDRVAFSGDLRLRGHGDELDNDPAASGLDLDELDRLRIRWRVGADVEVTDRWSLGFGLASGSDDPRSTNQTLRDAFSTGDVRLDYAFIRYRASEQLEVLGGKFKNPLWTPSQLLWDSDIRPDGLAAPMRFALSDTIEAFVNPAYLVLDEDVAGRREGAELWALQAGARIAFSDSAELTIAPTYYAFDDVEGYPSLRNVDVTSNSRDAAGDLLHDYDAASLGIELALGELRSIPDLTLLGEYVHNLDASDDDTGWLLGAALGSSVKEAGDWQFSYSYRRIEADAWPEIFADSDFFFGGTNAKGSEFQLDYGLARNVSVSAKYHPETRYIGSDTDHELLILDLMLKW